MTFHYRCFETDEFGRQIRKLDQHIQMMIDKAIKEVLFFNPYASKVLKDPSLKGKRSLRAGKYRIIFAICEECKKLHYERFNGCKDCKKHSTDDIMMFTCLPRRRVYEEY